MLCAKCSTENDPRQKFCKSCGATLGIVCDRCGSVNQPEDKHCGTCGQALAASLGQGEVRSAEPLKPLLRGVRQYTAQEIEELLLLRNTMKEVKHPIIMTQKDIDNLFG
jgi:hypothetical protein